MITSPENEKLKTIRKLARRRERERTGLFAAEGEDLVEAAKVAGASAEFVLIGGENVEAGLLDSVSELGSGTRVIGVFRQMWSEPGGDLSLYLHGVGDPGNVGTAIRSAHAFCEGPVVLGPGCADPFSPKAVRASMGSIFARPPARTEWSQLPGNLLALDGGADRTITEVELAPPVVVCVGAERKGLPPELAAADPARARIDIRVDGPESLNAATAATVALYELSRRITR
ncbi:MAG: TrmH family RNA methyltransferase [Solirubrobacterales bacterium]